MYSEHPLTIEKKTLLSSTPLRYRKNNGHESEMTSKLEAELAHLKMFINKLFYDLKNADYKLMVKFQHTLNLKDYNKLNLKKLEFPKLNTINIAELTQLKNQINDLPENEKKTTKKMFDEKSVESEIKTQRKMQDEKSIQCQINLNLFSNEEKTNNQRNVLKNQKNEANLFENIKEKEKELEGLMAKSKEFQNNMQEIEGKLKGLLKNEKENKGEILSDHKEDLKNQIKIIENENHSIKNQMRFYLEKIKQNEENLTQSSEKFKNENKVLLIVIEKQKNEINETRKKIENLENYINVLKEENHFISGKKSRELKNGEFLIESEIENKNNDEEVEIKININESQSFFILELEKKLDDLKKVNDFLFLEKKLKENHENDQKKDLLQTIELENLLSHLKNENFQIKREIQTKEENLNKEKLEFERENAKLLKENEIDKNQILILKNQINESNKNINQDFRTKIEQLENQLFIEDTKVRDNLNKEETLQNLLKEKENENNNLFHLKNLNDLLMIEKEEEFKDKLEFFEKLINELKKKNFSLKTNLDLYKGKLEENNLSKDEEEKHQKLLKEMEENNKSLILRFENEINELKELNNSLMNKKNEKEEEFKERLMLLETQINELQNENLSLLTNADLYKRKFDEINLINKKTQFENQDINNNENNQKKIEELETETNLLKNENKLLFVENYNSINKQEIIKKETEIFQEKFEENESVRKELIELQRKTFGIESSNEEILKKLEKHENAYENLTKKYQELYKNFRRLALEKNKI